MLEFSSSEKSPLTPEEKAAIYRYLHANMAHDDRDPQQVIADIFHGGALRLLFLFD